jgi:MtN3 and saliva related transmembrane protein
MEFSDIVGLAAGTCTSASLIPQLITTLKEKKARQVSWFMFIVLFVGNALWIYFGVLTSALPIILTNSFALVLNMIMLFLKYKYK